MTPTVARDLACRLVSEQPEKALSVARDIKPPWFRCQALSHVGRYWPYENYDYILREAIRAAELQDEAYKRVAVSAWPIRAYLERGNTKAARGLLDIYIPAAKSIANMGSRAEALLLLFEAAKPFASDLWQPAFRALIGASEPSVSWRQGRALKLAAGMALSENRGVIEDAVQRLSDARHADTLRTLLDDTAPQQMNPRPFFWTEAASK